MKARATKAPQHAQIHQRKVLPKLKALLAELRGLTTIASTLPSLSPVRGHMTQASKWLAERIKKLEGRSRGPSSRRSLKAG
jgi:hypothetical protein